VSHGGNVHVLFSLITELPVGGAGPVYRCVTIGVLPSDVLLEIFSFYVDEAYEDKNAYRLKQLEVWCTLVHVCRTWRKIVFASPCRLNLRLVCTNRRPVREMLDIWPTLPIVVQDWGLRPHQQPHVEGVDNIIAALGHRDRVCEISLGFPSLSLFHMCSTMMQESFLALTRLNLRSGIDMAMALSDSFLGGSAPSLRSLILSHISFPALAKLLLSTNDLVDLRLVKIPHSGYISPETMVTCLSDLASLKIFHLHFDSPRPRPHQSHQRSSSLVRVDLPALTDFYFRGFNEYIEDFVARINAPLLINIRVWFFNQLLFDLSQLAQFIDRGQIFKVQRHAAVVFDTDLAWVRFFRSQTRDYTAPMFCISSARSEWQLSSMAEVCSSFSSHLRLSSLERLDILAFTEPENWHDDMETIQWLELLLPFTAIRDLYLCKNLVLRLPQALQELTKECPREVLPALQSIFVEEHRPLRTMDEAIGPFIAARQLSGHPVAIHRWQPDWEEYYWRL
jgi:hypothetical protein